MHTVTCQKYEFGKVQQLLNSGNMALRSQGCLLSLATMLLAFNISCSPEHRGTGSTLYGQDGRAICNSIPIYGEGKEAGNEAAYIVGKSTCYPRPGSVKITDGESLVLESKYSRAQMHIGVMGLFYILVADQIPKPTSSSHTNHGVQINEDMKSSSWTIEAVACLGLAIAVAITIGYQLRRRDNITTATQN